ncbi:hypothetical protein A4X06_0g7927 [Tilletia controversa]|uniref:Uncharacterized protein n=4 Tax=Tilletia TaxID=13289 RepID=A0A8X7MLR4_9BASI|nr:hypothetical protein CF336_g7764 [Tilletia laevis]KAE8185982.1 hypothetical protein CF328_g7379 [Tilletia controversa]KAE8187248.1 hypothetical protein CF335_g7227 [Tilletia laevis]KAE8240051.1 hypothetical protein A4X06_0g7927 [Tilletia controversa]KAE8246789.1 hypothetical protein A4X03_0g7210 [Tilletia caries]
MQICRSSNLTFLVSAVLFCSMAVAMVAAAPVPASASSYGLEQHPAGDFVKRMNPAALEAYKSEALKWMSEADLAQLLATKEANIENWPAIKQKIDEGTINPKGGRYLGMTIADLAIKEAKEDAAKIKAELDLTRLRLGRPSSSS